LNAKPVLKIDWATHEAAKYACVNWHYSGCVPPSKSVKIGAWEDGAFIGVVVFGVGATQAIGSPFGLKPIEVCELVRVALNKHKTAVSRIISIAVRFLAKQSPGLRLIVSYADPNQGHHGGIYQAGNWVYIGKNPGSSYEVICPDGIQRHARAAIHKYKSCAGFKRVEMENKHKYVMPLDEKMRLQIEPLRKPYPSRAGSKANVASAFHAEEGGATPTPALQSLGGPRG
jgi:hypothetical protein